MGGVAAELADLSSSPMTTPAVRTPRQSGREILPEPPERGGAAQVVEIGDRRAAIRHAVHWAAPVT